MFVTALLNIYYSSILIRPPALTPTGKLQCPRSPARARPASSSQKALCPCQKSEKLDHIRHGELCDHDEKSGSGRAQSIYAPDHRPRNTGSDHSAQKHVSGFHFSKRRNAVASCCEPHHKTDCKCSKLHPSVADPYACCFCYLRVKYALYTHQGRPIKEQ